MTATRDRKQAAKILGITMQAQLRELQQANGQQAIEFAAIRLGDTFNRNADFIIWVLKEFGGVDQMPYPRNPPAPRADLKLVEPAPPANLPDLPEFLSDPKTVN